MTLLRTKPIGKDQAITNELKQCLSGLDLTLLGIGAIIGAGVFVLTGVAAATKAGPGITLSYIIAGFACLFAALSYAELASSVGGCGSAYSYAYASFGEIVAWIIGWDLLLEYSMSVSTVAIGWSGYVNDALKAIHIHLPAELTKNPFDGGWVNLPAIIIISLLAFLLSVGVKQSSKANGYFVTIKLFTIAFFIIVAAKYIDLRHWKPFLPFGWTGVMEGASLVFFAYIGFDAVSTAAEETIHPQRDIPVGIIASLIICTAIYIVVAALLTSIVNYSTLNVASPVSNALLQLNQHFAAGLVSVGAIAGLTTVMLVMYYGLTRIFYAMARDGLLPKIFYQVNPITKTPDIIIILSGMVMALIAGLVPIGESAKLVNIGTLSAFILVCAGVVILRHKHPDLPRPFKLPWSPFVPLLGVFSCLYLMAYLSWLTWISFIIWTVMGLIIYFLYGRKHSFMNQQNLS